MARAITLNAPVRDPREELIQQVEQAPAAHAEALLDAWELLEQLHERGVLQLARGVVGAGDKLVDHAAEVVNSTPAVDAFRNLIVLGKIFAAIDPEILRGVSGAITETMRDRNGNEEPPGLLKLFAALRTKEVRRSMGLITRFLSALGSQMRATPKEEHQVDKLSRAA